MTSTLSFVKHIVSCPQHNVHEILNEGLLPCFPFSPPNPITPITPLNWLWLLLLLTMSIITCCILCKTLLNYSHWSVSFSRLQTQSPQSLSPTEIDLFSCWWSRSSTATYCARRSQCTAADQSLFPQLKPNHFIHYANLTSTYSLVNRDVRLLQHTARDAPNVMLLTCTFLIFSDSIPSLRLFLSLSWNKNCFCKVLYVYN